MYLLDGIKAPFNATFGNFIRNELSGSIEQIFNDINSYIFEVDNVDLEQTYIYGIKIEANANRYTWYGSVPALRIEIRFLTKFLH